MRIKMVLITKTIEMVPGIDSCNGVADDYEVDVCHKYCTKCHVIDKSSENNFHLHVLDEIIDIYKMEIKYSKYITNIVKNGNRISITIEFDDTMDVYKIINDVYYDLDYFDIDCNYPVCINGNHYFLNVSKIYFKNKLIKYIDPLKKKIIPPPQIFEPILSARDIYNKMNPFAKFHTK